MRLYVNISVALVVEVMLSYPRECCWRQPQLTVPTGVDVRVIILLVAILVQRVLNCLDSLLPIILKSSVTPLKTRNWLGSPIISEYDET